MSGTPAYPHISSNPWCWLKGKQVKICLITCAALNIATNWSRAVVTFNIVVVKVYDKASKPAWYGIPSNS